MDTVDQKFLRGYQVTDANGVVTFTTIDPGWYQGRTVHFHFKLCTRAGSDQGYQFTSQRYFDDSVTDRVLSQQPYAGKGGQRDTTNATDMPYANGGDQPLLALTEANGGYAATFPTALDLADTDTRASDRLSTGNGGPGGPGGPGDPPPGAPQQPGEDATATPQGDSQLGGWQAPGRCSRHACGEGTLGGATGDAAAGSRPKKRSSRCSRQIIRTRKNQTTTSPRIMSWIGSGFTRMPK